jgi:hypothetical protein
VAIKGGPILRTLGDSHGTGITMSSAQLSKSALVGVDHQRDLGRTERGAA